MDYKYTLLFLCLITLLTIIHSQQSFRQSSPQAFASGQQVINQNDWKFTFNQDDVTIGKNNNVIKTIDNRGLANSQQNGVVDHEGQNRYSLLPGMTLHPQANKQLKNTNNLFQRYYFDIDNYYPYVRIKDSQTRYQIGQYGLIPPSQGPTHVCPPFTFRHLDKCLSQCPDNYKSQIRQEYGQCKINCENGFIEKDNVCTSVSYPQRTFEKQANRNYLLGNYCTDNQYFNNNNNKCVSNCSVRQVALNISPNQNFQGICAPCPQNCVTCQQDKQQKYNYLICTRCDFGYKIQYGRCVLDCDVKYCSKCVQQQPDICSQCAPMYRLQNNLCVADCPDGDVPILDNSGKLYCKEPQNDNLDESDYVGGVYNGQPFIFRKQCGSDLKVYKQQCVNKCPDGFEEIQNQGISVCTCNTRGAYLINGQCQIKTRPQGMYLHPVYLTYFNCDPGCIECSYSGCLKCSNDQILMVSQTFNSYCQKFNPYFSCNSKYYKYDAENRICYFKDSNQDYCQNNGINNCSICLPKKSEQALGGCVLCNNTQLILRYGSCIEKCLQGYENIDGQCIPKKAHCQKLSKKTYNKKYPIGKDFINSDSYRTLTKDHTYVSGDPLLQKLFIRDQLYVKNPEGIIGQNKFFSQDYQCQQCITDTYEIINGECVPKSGCKQQNKRFRYEGQCRSSCPEQTYPQIDTDNRTLICVSEDQANVTEEVRIDSSVYPLNNGNNLYYFVIDTVLNNPNVSVEVKQSFASRVQQATGLNQDIPSAPSITKFKDRTYIAVQSSAPQVAIDFGPSLQNIRGADGQLLSNSIIGVKAQRNHLNYQTSWLAIVAYVLSLLTIMLHVIYIGNYLLYKVDNLLVFVQSIWYFLFIKIFVGHPLAQYYWGYSWSHFQFFPNYFSRTIPEGYYEGFNPTDTVSSEGQYLSNSYRLGSGDANFIRNAGFSFTLLITFIVAYLVVILVIFILQKICKKSELWYYKIAKQAIFAAIQFVSFNILYWAIAHLRYNQHPFDAMYEGQKETYINFRRNCSIAAIVFLALIVLYTIIRGYFHKYGGLYMLKRIAYAGILVGSVHQFIITDVTSQYVNFTQKQAFVILIVGFQLIFILLRWILERPKHRRQKFFIIAESALMAISFLIMYLWNNTGVVSVFVSIFIFVFLLFLIEDLIDVYNDSRDQFYDEQVGIVPGAMQKIQHPQSERAKLNY